MPSFDPCRYDAPRIQTSKRTRRPRGEVLLAKRYKNGPKLCIDIDINAECLHPIRRKIRLLFIRSKRKRFRKYADNRFRLGISHDALRIAVPSNVVVARHIPTLSLGCLSHRILFEYNRPGHFVQ
jgi:hypothetical protein